MSQDFISSVEEGLGLQGLAFFEKWNVVSGYSDFDGCFEGLHGVYYGESDRVPFEPRTNSAIRHQAIALYYYLKFARWQKVKITCEHVHGGDFEAVFEFRDLKYGSYSVTYTAVSGSTVCFLFSG